MSDPNNPILSALRLAAVQSSDPIPLSDVGEIVATFLRRLAQIGDGGHVDVGADWSIYTGDFETLAAEIEKAADLVEDVAP